MELRCISLCFSYFGGGLVTKLCSTLAYIDCSPQGFSVRGILQARILEWVAISSSGGSSRSRDWTCVSWGSCAAGGFFISEPQEKPLIGRKDLFSD